MIYVFRGLTVFAILNLINIYLYDGGAGMEPVWVMMIIAFALLSTKKLYAICFENKYFKGVFWVGVVVFLLIEAAIIINGYKTTLETPSDCIIVLGARVRGETPSLTLKNRLDVAYEYLEQHEETIAILSGGQGPDEDITEAEAMRRYLVAKGIDESRIILEDQSTSTYENMQNSFEILDAYPQEIDEIIVVTSRFHILRSKLIAKKMGRQVEGIGASTLPFLVPNYYLREFFAVIKEVIVR